MKSLLVTTDFVVGNTYSIGGKVRPFEFTVTDILPPELEHTGPMDERGAPTIVCSDGKARRWPSTWRAFRHVAGPDGVKAKRLTTTYLGAGGCACTTRARYTVPAVFFEDHANRNLLVHDVTATEMSNGLRVELCPQDVAELLSDARHYVDGGTSTFGSDMLGLISSARATVKRLTR